MKTEDEKKEYRRKYWKEYYIKNKEKILKKNSEWQQENTQKYKNSRKEYHLKYHQDRRAKLWKKALEFFGPCACCGESRIEFLAIDHINGGGKDDNKHNPGWNKLRRLEKDEWPEDAKKTYRILCHNCNASLGSYGYCPHQNL